MTDETKGWKRADNREAAELVAMWCAGVRQLTMERLNAHEPGKRLVMVAAMVEIMAHSHATELRKFQRTLRRGMSS